MCEYSVWESVYKYDVMIACRFHVSIGVAATER